MQNRVASSQNTVCPSSRPTPICQGKQGHPHLKNRSPRGHLVGQLIGVAFWSTVSVALCCWFAINGRAAQTNDENVLLDFSARWCGPCQRMSPIVSNLERQGYPIRKVDIDVEKELANRFRIEGIPCFVLIVNGREVERVSGMQDEKALRAMMMKLPKPDDQVATTTKSSTTANDRKLLAKNVSSSAKNNDPKLVPTDPNDTVRGQSPQLDASVDAASQKVLCASTRIKVTSGKDVRYGSGTIIESEPGRSVILTCGHILRGYKKNGMIEVDCYPGGKSKPQTYAGQVIAFDAESDIGLLEIASTPQLPVVKIGVGSKALAKKDRVVSVGCGGGERPSIQNHFVTSLNRYEGPDTIECSGIPEQGRSGGGLFLDSELVGVCILADPKDKRGIYSGLKPVVQMLTKWNYGHLVPSLTSVEEIASDIEPPKGSVDLGEVVAMNDEQPLRSNDGYTEALQEAMQDSGVTKFDSSDYVGAEVICIVRPKKPGKTSRVVVVNQATSRFVDDLLRDSAGGERPEPTATVRVTPRKTSEKSNSTMAKSDKNSGSKDSSIDDSWSDDPYGRVRTAFEPQNTRGKRK